MNTADAHEVAWELLAAQREPLLRIARRRACSPEAAEDAVQEALARAAARWDLIDPEQVGAWLTVVTMHLCADEHRRRSRERRVLPRLVHGPMPDPADVVAQRSEDAWVVEQVGSLSDGQRQVLHLVAAEGGVPAAARRLGVSRQSAESLLKRARANVRARIAVTLGALGLGSWRRAHRAGTVTGGAAAGLAAVSLSLVTTLPGVLGAPSPAVLRPPHGHVAMDRATDEASTDEILAVRRIATRSAVSRPARPIGPVVAAPRTTRRVIVPPRDYRVGPAKYHDGGAGFDDRDETLEQTIQRCVDRGVEVSATYIGCRRRPHA